MPGELWIELLPLLRRGDTLAWNQTIEACYEQVYTGLLSEARRRNSSKGAPLPDPEVQDLAVILTNEAFMVGKARIEVFDPERSFPVWIYWLGRARCKGLLDPLLRQEQARARQENLDAVDGAGLATVPSAEAEVVAAEERTERRARFAAILAAMRAEWATAIVQVQLARDEGYPNPVQIVAARTGRSVESMDSLLRRATRDLKRRWKEAYGSDPLALAR
jgi:RNA polymerase sigma factor (sigma-70 family)